MASCIMFWLFTWFVSWEDVKGRRVYLNTRKFSRHAQNFVPCRSSSPYLQQCKRYTYQQPLSGCCWSQETDMFLFKSSWCQGHWGGAILSSYYSMCFSVVDFLSTFVSNVVSCRVVFFLVALLMCNCNSNTFLFWIMCVRVCVCMCVCVLFMKGGHVRLCWLHRNPSGAQECTALSPHSSGSCENESCTKLFG